MQLSIVTSQCQGYPGYHGNTEHPTNIHVGDVTNHCHLTAQIIESTKHFLAQ